MEGKGGKIACVVDLFALLCFVPCGMCTMGFAWNRSKVREKYDLKGGIIVDFCLYIWCGCCAATQEYRECRARATVDLTK